MKQTLFLMIGYPGSGKTTVSKLIYEQTGAVHLWADYERRKMFGNPTHSPAESRKLYTYLNDVTDKLLAEGKSVIFDTNFNFYKDRGHLREIAAKHGAKTAVIWITTPKEIAKQRAVQESHSQRTRVFGNMPREQFERIARNLEPPREDEHPIKLDGTNITPKAITAAIQSA